MNASNDSDRRLSAWLEDGPSGAAERSIDAAVAHAGSHPRRRDPFAFLRKDPMDTTPRAAATRPLLLVALIGLLIVASFTAASVGGFLDRPAVVVPVATASPTPSAQPSVEPSASAAPSPAAFDVDLVENVGADASIHIIDESHTVVSATSQAPAEGGSVPEGAVAAAVLAADPASIVLTWTGSPCDTVHTLTIAPDGRTMSIERPACSGDSIPVDHVLVLKFKAPVPLDAIRATVHTVRS
jgi:hypothetical protein